MGVGVKGRFDGSRSYVGWGLRVLGQRGWGFTVLVKRGVLAWEFSGGLAWGLRGAWHMGLRECLARRLRGRAINGRINIINGAIDVGGLKEWGLTGGGGRSFM